MSHMLRCSFTYGRNCRRAGVIGLGRSFFELNEAEQLLAPANVGYFYTYLWDTAERAYQRSYCPFCSNNPPGMVRNHCRTSFYQRLLGTENKYQLDTECLPWILPDSNVLMGTARVLQHGRTSPHRAIQQGRVCRLKCLSSHFHGLSSRLGKALQLGWQSLQGNNDQASME